jgi:hypothetical protein
VISHADPIRVEANTSAPNIGAHAKRTAAAWRNVAQQT